MESSEVFVGRHTALAVLREAWTDAAAAHPRIVAVTGTAGMGKSSLLRHFTSTFAPDHVHWIGMDECAASASVTLIPRLVHELTGLPSAVAPDSADEIAAGAAALQAMGTPPQPYVLIVDDLQWADAFSIRALRFALRRLEAEPALIILAVRTEAPASAEDDLRGFITDPRVTACTLDGLTMGEIVELAALLNAGPLDPTTAERLREHTGGLPLHTVALLAEHGGKYLADAGRVLPVPRSLAAIVHDKQLSLSPTTQRFLDAAAVLGAVFPASTAAQMVGLEEAEPAVSEALAAGLLSSASAGRAAFGHPLLRAAIYSALPLSRRRQLHLSAAALTLGVDALLHRVDASEGFDDELADDLAAAAAAAGATDAFGPLQGELLLAATRCTTARSRRDARLVEAAAAFMERGLAARARALRPLLDATAPTTAGEAVLALLDIDDGRFPAARDRCTAALDAEIIDAGAARVRAARALARWAEGDFEGAANDASAALHGDVGAATARCCYLRTVSMAVLGRLQRSPGEQLPAVLRRADRLALEGISRFHRNDISGAISSLGEAVRQSRSGHPTQLFIIVLGVLSEALFREGRWDEAALHAELSVSLARDTDAYGELLLSHAAAAEIQAARGRFEASAEHLHHVRNFATAMPTWPTLTRLGMTQAVVAIAEDDADALVAAAETMCAEPGRTQVSRRPSIPWRALLAEAQLVAGDLDEASRTIDELAAAARAARAAGAAPDLARLTGWLAEARGRIEEARSAYDITEHAARAAHAPLAVARLTMARGLLQMHVGEHAAGRTTLIEARAAFATLGALPFLRRCEQALDAADRESVAAKFPLSPRQEAVALLVAENMTNREIAHRLFVTVKAVEYHLGQIYARTGLSRRELGVRMRQSPTWSARGVAG